MNIMNIRRSQTQKELRKLDMLIYTTFSNILHNVSRSVKDEYLVLQIPLKEILKIDQYKITEQLKQMINEFEKIQTLWIFKTKYQEMEIHLTIKFLLNGKLDSFLSNVIPSNLNQHYSFIKEQCSKQKFIVSQNGFFEIKTILSKLNIKKLDTQLRKLKEIIWKIFEKVFKIENPQKYENISKEENALYSRKTVKQTRKLVIVSKLGNISLINSSVGKKNIRVFKNDVEVCLKEPFDKSKRVFMQHCTVSGGILSSANMDEIEQTIKPKNFLLRTERIRIQGATLSFLENEVQTLYQWRNQFCHQNIGKYYLRRTENTKGQEKQVYCQLYKKKFKGFFQKKLMQQNPEFILFINIILQLISFLSYLQEKGFVHADIKDDNIMLEQKEGRLIVKVIDNEGLILCSQLHRTDDFRNQFSTKGYFYELENGEGLWKHPKFDMYALGKIIKKHLNFGMPKIAENCRSSLFSKAFEFLRQISDQCMKDPRQINEQFTYSLWYVEIREFVLMEYMKNL